MQDHHTALHILSVLTLGEVFWFTIIALVFLVPSAIANKGQPSIRWLKITTIFVMIFGLLSAYGEYPHGAIGPALSSWIVLITVIFSGALWFWAGRIKARAESQ